MSVAAFTFPSGSAVVDFGAPIPAWLYSFALWKGSHALRWASWVMLAVLLGGTVFERMLDSWPMLLMLLFQLSLAFYTRRGAPEVTPVKRDLPVVDRQQAVSQVPVVDDYTDVIVAFTQVMQHRSRTFESDSVLPFPRERIVAALVSARKDPFYATAPVALDHAERALATYLPESRIEHAAGLLRVVQGQLSEGNDR
jgi:hypothetical protein